MIKLRLTPALVALTLIAGCAKEPPPRTVTEFLDDHLLLEAALLRCDKNRSELRYDRECINAREAVKIIEAKQEAERRERLEAQSQRKREALRRTQEAAAEARRRVAEAERRRREAEYLAQFGTLPPPDDGSGEEGPDGNVPMAIIPEAAPESTEEAYEYDDYASRDNSATAPPPAGSNAPAADTSPPPEESPRDLDSIREELRRRNEQDGTG